MSRVIVIGGGLSGLSAAHTVLERGGNVLVLDKMAFCGGNSTKATSGINGALTRTQQDLGIPDSAETFYRDTAASALKGQFQENDGFMDPKNNPYLPLNRVLAYHSAPAVHWLQDAFNLDLSLVGQLGGASFPRTHRGKEKFPGMTITYALMEKLEKIIEEHPHRATLLTKARATELITENGAVVGVKYEKGGKTFTEHGPVVVATGGFGADFTENSILQQVRPEWAHLPTTNGPHCTGDGLKMCRAIGGGDVDLEWVQVHPTGMVHPDEPDAKVKFLAAEALRGAGGIILDNQGHRFVDELQRRDHVTGKMWDRKAGPYRLVLNSAAASQLTWHVEHYEGRGLMKKVNGGAELAALIGCPEANLSTTFNAYNKNSKTGKPEPVTGKKFFPACPWSTNDSYYVAEITPVIHYTMGGVTCNEESAVTTSFPNGDVIPGVFVAGEVMGAVHGRNRLGGSSLLDCVVFGRVAGNSAARYQLGQLASGKVSAASGASGLVNLTIDPNTKSVTINFDGNTAPAAASAGPAGESGKIPRDTSYDFDGEGNSDKAEKAEEGDKEYTMAEVAKHTTKDDCWVVVNGEVLNATSFLEEHPGGAKAIMLYAGKDATKEFNMLHEANVVKKYAPEIIIGTLKPSAKL